MHDEPDIIASILAGSHARYRTLVDRHAGSVRSFLIQRLGDPDRAEEAAQLSFVRAFERLASLKDRGKFVGWVLGIAAKVAMEQSRVRRAGGLAPLHTLDLRGAATDFAQQRDAGLEAAVASLEEPYREAVRLRYWCGLSCEQTALRQGVGLGTLTKRLSRAHAMLREMMDPGPPGCLGGAKDQHTGATR